MTVNSADRRISQERKGINAIIVEWMTPFLYAAPSSHQSLGFKYNNIQVALYRRLLQEDGLRQLCKFVNLCSRKTTFECNVSDSYFWKVGNLFQLPAGAIMCRSLCCSEAKLRAKLALHIKLTHRRIGTGSHFMVYSTLSFTTKSAALAFLILLSHQSPINMETLN